MKDSIWGQVSTLSNELDLGLSPTSFQLFTDHLDLVDRWNAVVTLSTITDRAEQALKHVYDSLQLARFIDETVKRVADVGTGGGFPGGPIGVVFPQLDLTFIEKDSAKCRFLEVLSGRLDLRATVLCESSVDVAFRGETFEMVTSRALISPPETMSYVLPLVALGGRAVIMLGPSAKDMVGTLEVIGNKVGCELEELIEYELPGGFGERLILSLRRFRKDEVR